MRFEDRLEITINADPSVLGALVPTFILQPLVENAIRHGVSTHHGKGVIQVDAWRSDDDLAIRVCDNGPGLPTGWSLEQGSGLGLANTRARLQSLYGDVNRRFSILAGPRGGVRVELTVPLHLS